MRCHACDTRTHGRKLESRAVFCWGRIRNCSIAVKGQISLGFPKQSGFAVGFLRNKLEKGLQYLHFRKRTQAARLPRTQTRIKTTQRRWGCPAGAGTSSGHQSWLAVAGSCERRCCWRLQKRSGPTWSKKKVFIQFPNSTLVACRLLYRSNKYLLGKTTESVYGHFYSTKHFIALRGLYDSRNESFEKPFTQNYELEI